MAAGSHENEIKLAAPGVAEAKRMLYAAGFRVSKRRVFEDNTVLDTRRLELRKSARLLRVRQAGRKVTVTYKGRPIDSRHKSREEVEMEASGAREAALIFERLGFRRVFRYQKFRTEYKQHGQAGIATLDETPIGVYLELEGKPEWVDRAARKLGFTEKAYITKSYGRLYLEWCKAHGKQAVDMVF